MTGHYPQHGAGVAPPLVLVELHEEKPTKAAAVARMRTIFFIISFLRDWGMPFIPIFYFKIELGLSARSK